MKPEWTPIFLVCFKCRHDWEDWQPCHCPVDTWVAHVKTYRCPECGARAKSIGLRSMSEERTSSPNQGRAED